jgi:restriction system protein
MADMLALRMGEFLRIIFMFLWTRQDGAPTQELLAHVAQTAQLSEQERAPSPAAPEFPYFEVAIRSALTAVLKAGWLVKDKGCWSITEEGRQACKDFQGAEQLYLESQRLYRDWRLSRPSVWLTVEQAEQTSRDQIQKYLQGLKHHEFRQLIGDLLKAMGYRLAWVAPPGKERGNIDLIVHADALGLQQPRLLVQLKHKGQAVTAEGLKAALGVLGPDDYGLFVSSGGFTHDARESVSGYQKVSLMDLEKFFDLWVEYYDRLSLEARMRFPLQSIYFLASEE